MEFCVKSFDVGAMDKRGSESDGENDEKHIFAFSGKWFLQSSFCGDEIHRSWL